MDFLNLLFEPYKAYSTLHVLLEILAVIFSIVSVLYSKNNNIKVYPAGIISTIILIYLSFVWELFGDFIINWFYLMMSIYGWIYWKRINNKQFGKIEKINKSDLIFIVVIGLIAIVITSFIYSFYNRLGIWWSYLDILTTSLMFIGMWLLAKRKIENWLFLLVADLISIPMYFIKGYILMSLLFIVYSVVAILGYLEWKKVLRNQIHG